MLIRPGAVGRVGATARFRLLGNVAIVINTLVVEGSSSTSTNPDSAASSGDDTTNKYAYKYRAQRTDKTIRVRAQAGRTVLVGGALDDGSNTMMGHVTEDAGFGPQAIFAMCLANDMASRSYTLCKGDLQGLYAQYSQRGIKFIFAPCCPYNPDANPRHQFYDQFTANRAQLIGEYRDPAVWNTFADYICPLGEHPIFVDDTAAAYNGDQLHAATAGDAAYLAVFKAYLDTLFDASRVDSQTVYNSVWPANQTGLAKNTSVKLYVVLSGLAHKGVTGGASVSGGNATIRRGQGTFGASVGGSSTSPLLNGDVLTIQVTTSAASNTAVPVQLTINGETRTINFQTAVETVYTSTFDSTKKGNPITLDAAKLKATGTNSGSNAPYRVGSVGALSTGNGYFEVTSFAGAGNNSYDLLMAGFANSSYGWTTAGTFGRSANSWAASIAGASGNYGFTYAGSGTVQSSPSPSQFSPPAYGATTGIFVHKATNTVFLRLASGWFPQTPVLNADGTLASGTGRASGLTEYIAGIGTASDVGGTINFGASPFVYGPPANGEPGWKTA